MAMAAAMKTAQAISLRMNSFFLTRVAPQCGQNSARMLVSFPQSLHVRRFGFRADCGGGAAIVVGMGGCLSTSNMGRFSMPHFGQTSVGFSGDGVISSKQPPQISGITD